LQHLLFHLTLGGKLFCSPVHDKPKDVLHVATGDGTWVLDFAYRNPATSIIARNLAQGTKKSPPNVVFETDDANKAWTYKQQFDFIHCRQQHRTLNEQTFFEQGWKFLHPGGWLEMQELCNPLRSDDGTLTADSALSRWGQLLVEASTKMDRPADNPTRYASWMQAAGFTNVETIVYKWPTNPWSQDEREKLKGLWNLYNVLERLREFTSMLLTKVLGWSQEDVDSLLVDVRTELQDPNVHVYWPVYVVYGQKPLVEEADQA
ncbi:S-adenosyl-L-methionine-dependent methyltransferase, partial [Aspergillus steynii IBT 23096]